MMDTPSIYNVISRSDPMRYDLAAQSHGSIFEQPEYAANADGLELSEY